MRHVFRSYLERGGAELGLKKNIILQVVELGAKLHFGLRCDFELLMFDTEMYDARVQSVQNAFNVLHPKLEAIYGRDKPVKVNLVASWPPALSKTLKSGEPRLFSKPVVMESIAGHSVDMEEADTVPFPAIPNATTIDEAYSTKEYTLAHRSEGRKNMKLKVDSLNEYELLFLDSNKFLFEDRNKVYIQGSGGSTLQILVERGYQVDCVVWGHQMTLLAGEKKAILLHCPLCQAAPCVPRPMERIIQRGMLVQLSMMVAGWCQRSNRGRLNQQTFHDAILAGYAFEHARTSLHTSWWIAAASARDVLTPESTFAMVQNDLHKRPLGEKMAFPLAKNLRQVAWGRTTKYNLGYSVKCSIMNRIMNILRQQPPQLNLSAARDLYNELDAVMHEDEPTKKTFNKRWKMVQKYLRPGSVLLRAIEESMPEKSNKGNPKARGYTKAEMSLKVAEMDAIKGLETNEEFWVLFKSNIKGNPPVTPEKRGRKVFPNVAFRTVQNNFVMSKNARSVYKVKTTGNYRAPVIMSENGAFILCKLVPRVANYQDG